MMLYGEPMAPDTQVLTVDIFGTTVDWWTGVREQVAEVATEHGLQLDAGEFTSAWRDRYLPSMARVRAGERPWAYLDTLHRESLDELLAGVPGADRLDESVRTRLVRAWHRLPAWPDSAAGLDRLRRRYTVVALSNGGFALMTALLKCAGLAVDAIVSAELARNYKPEPVVYRTAAALLDVVPEQMMMVACHAWDLAGARAAGLATAFVERPAEKGPHGQADRACDAPGALSCAGLTELADLLGC
jgi:2-haloacid dehalogenase